MKDNDKKDVGLKVEDNGKVLPVKSVNEMQHLLENEGREARGEEIQKNAENAVPPEAWKDQKKAYNDAWENNKNQLNED